MNQQFGGKIFTGVLLDIYLKVKNLELDINVEELNRWLAQEAKKSK